MVNHPLISLYMAQLKLDVEDMIRNSRKPQDIRDSIEVIEHLLKLIKERVSVRT